MPVPAFPNEAASPTLDLPKVSKVTLSLQRFLSTLLVHAEEKARLRTLGAVLLPDLISRMVETRFDSSKKDTTQNIFYGRCDWKG